MSSTYRSRLLASAFGAGLLGVAAPGWAQDNSATPSSTQPPIYQSSPNQPPSAEASTDQPPPEQPDIIVTGSLLRQYGGSGVSPVTTVSAESLEQRGINTVQEGIQRLPSNNGPALTNSFSANGAFAAGASAVSLRGLSTNSTLVLFNGQRAAYYPLADDATRNFVDLNTIPDDIVDRIEVLRDGASSTYGADAIAGVVNVITKRQITGINARAEAGVSERGDAANQRLSLTVGFGDLNQQGFNAYVSGFYYHQDALYNRDRPYPYNSQDQSGICLNGVCGPNIGPNGGSINPSSGPEGFGNFSTSTDRSLFATTFFVAPAGAGNTAETGRYQILNPAAGCIAGERPYTLTAAEFAGSPRAPATVCQGDLVTQYGVIAPDITRWGVSFRGTADVTDTLQAYLEGNFLQSNVSYSGNPATIRANGPAGINFPRFSTAGPAGGANAPGSFVLALPVYVCPLVNERPQATCDATTVGARLNPNNPFAASGQVARILGRIPNVLEFNETRNRTYRLAGGVSGDITDNWRFQVNAVAMRSDLTRIQNGYVNIQRLLNVVADGRYNFVNPLSNSQAVLDYLSPSSNVESSSELYSGQASVAGKLFTLPGGPVEVAVGGEVRYEAINAPSANNDINGPTERYFVLNAFGTRGNRTIESAFGEIRAPVFKQLELNASGRYDHYSSGQSAFSPKFGVRITPVPAVVLRGTFSRGFRIPSFAEANAIPTTGFVTAASSLYNDTYLAQYGCTVADFNACPTYIRTAAYGQTTLASPNLDPEKSRSWTGGITINPIRNVTLTFDFFDITKTGAITTPSNRPALLAYYTGQAIPAGYNVIPDTADPNFPNARPRVAFVQSALINANTQHAQGFDIGANGRFNLTSGIRLSSTLEASYIIDLSTTFPDGTVERYAGTLGNFNLTAGSGTPRWRGTWQNTFEFSTFSLTGTVNYFGGYNLSAADQGTEPGDCGLRPVAFVPCDVSDYVTFDLSSNVRVARRLNVYFNVQNLFDDLPPIDPVTYGANNYNPVQGGEGIYGRTFRAGVRVGL